MIITYPELDRLLSFASVHHMIRAEKLLAEEGIKTIQAPTPREIDISCGQCLLFSAIHAERVLDILHTAHVRWSKLYTRDSVNKMYTKITEYGG